MILNIFSSLLEVYRNFKGLVISFMFSFLSYMVYSVMSLVTLSSIITTPNEPVSFIISVFRQNLWMYFVVIGIFLLTLFFSSLSNAYVINSYMNRVYGLNRGNYEGFYRYYILIISVYSIIWLFIITIFMINSSILYILSFVFVLLFSLFTLPFLVFVPISILIKRSAKESFKDSYDQVSSRYFSTLLTMIIFSVIPLFASYLINYFVNYYYLGSEFVLGIEGVLLFVFNVFFVFWFLSLILVSYNYKK